MATKEIWVLAEIRGGRATQGTLQLLGAARALAAQQGGAAVAVLVGGGAQAAAELSQLAPAVVRIDGARLDPYEASRHAAAVTSLAQKRGVPFALMAPASAKGLELVPRIAALLGCGYAGSCVALSIDGGALVARRPVHGGKAYEEVSFSAAPAALTARPGGFPMPEKLPAEGGVESIAIEVPAGFGFEVIAVESTGAGRQDVAEARRVVTGGRGMGDPERFALVESLAGALGAAVGASRALVDAGVRPHGEQVGKSGKTISPELYVACGISGAIHHTLGMNTSKVVVAINTDPAALIFKSADYGIVGDGRQILPALVEAIEKIAKKA
jgi:electron transfer flavoprotein alpha subunit